MPAVTFSRRHYRFIFKLFVFIVLCGLVVVFVFRKGDGLSNDIEAKAAWIKDSVFLKSIKEDDRIFWEVNHHNYCNQMSFFHSFFLFMMIRNHIQLKKLIGTTTNNLKKRQSKQVINKILKNLVDCHLLIVIIIIQDQESKVLHSTCLLKMRRSRIPCTKSMALMLS